MATSPKKQPKAQPEVTAEETNKPSIEYFGEGATDVQFEIDPRAVRMRVFADGRILTDY